jgi:hypothetical protein
MKKTIALLILMCAPALASTLPTNAINGHIGLTWTYPTNAISNDLRFQFYGTTNLTVPWSNWPVITNVAATNFAPYQVTQDGTNWVATNLSIRLDLQPGQYFFVGTASNFWGETSVTSSITSTPPAPVAFNDSLKIQKTP